MKYRNYYKGSPRTRRSNSRANRVARRTERRLADREALRYEDLGDSSIKREV